MRLKDAKGTYGVSSTYYYKLKGKANGDDKEFIRLLEEYNTRKTNRANKTDDVSTSDPENK